MKMLFQIVEESPDEFGAGAKAPEDARKIAAACGFKPFSVCRRSLKGRIGRCLSILDWLVRCVGYVIRMPRNALVFVQYPIHYQRSKVGVAFLGWLKSIKHVTFITLVHDINQLRNLASESEDSFLNRVMDVSSSVIVHNEKMLAWLAEKGVPQSKLVNLEIFDYLTSSVVPEGDADFRRITLAGNLGLWGKCPFIHHLRDVKDVEWELYGAGFDPEKSGGPNVHFNGCFPADEVTGHLSKGFGLVWDGDSVDTCSGGWGEYLLYNNPHKMSMYLAAGLPVVIWSKAAQAAFVEKYKVGFSVDSLRDIGARLRDMSNEDYQFFSRNARAISEKVRNGGFLTEALNRGRAASSFLHEDMNVGLIVR